MRALTLHQPHATLIALGVKTIETRSWATSYRGPIAIHAAKRVPTPERGPMFVGDFHIAQGGTWLHGPDIDVRFPLGAIVATATLADVVPIGSYASLSGPPVRAAHLLPVEGSDAERAILVRDERFAAEAIATNGPLPAEIDATDQLPYGDFTPGRYAWLLEDVKPTTERCPACWGVEAYEFDRPWEVESCPTCHGYRHCDPIPAKGRQGLWNWEPSLVPPKEER